jgi:hypothetical protein
MKKNINLRLTIQIPDDVEEEFSGEVNNYIINYLELIQNIAPKLEFKSTFGYDHITAEEEMAGIKHEFIYFHIWGTMQDLQTSVNLIKMLEGLSGLLNNQDLIENGSLKFL